MSLPPVDPAIRLSDLAREVPECGAGDQLHRSHRITLSLYKVLQDGEYGGVNRSVEVSVTFRVDDADTICDIFSGVKSPEKGGYYLYGRCGNPTVRHLSAQLAAIEGAEAAYCCSSGMAAVSSALLHLCNSGDHIVASNSIYGGTFGLLRDLFPKKCGIHTSFVPINDLEAVAGAVTERTRVLYCETVSNPTLLVADLPRLAELANAKGLTLVVDNTFAPMVVSPIRWGAHVVLHSLTKFVSGASDIVAGAVCGSRELIAGMMDIHGGTMMLLGPTLDPKTASELALRMPHLGLRMREHSLRALRFAEGLQELGARVLYPGLPSHPQHQLFRELANPGYGAGGLLSIDLGTYAAAKAFMGCLQHAGFGLLAVSLGYFDTLVSASASSTASGMKEEALRLAGISLGLVRMSVGITGTLEQRWAQLERAFLAAEGGAESAAAAEDGVSRAAPLQAAE